MTVVHDFSNASTLSMSTYALTIGGASTNTGTMKFGGASNGLPFSGGTVEYNGSIAQQVAGGTYGVLVLSNTGVKTLLSDVTTLGDLTIGIGAPVTISNSVNVSVNGSVANGGSITNNGMLIVGP